MKFLLDTNLLVGILRDSPFAKYAQKKHAFLTPPNLAFVSVVSIGEIKSLAYQWNWGESKKQALSELIHSIPAIDIYRSEIIERYVEIDAYS
jgi:tRNA(fMet)-specific endonuclease VapC